MQICKKAAILALIGFFLLIPFLVKPPEARAAPLKAPAISINGTCDTTLSFTITNTGDAMTVPYTWAITVAGYPFENGSFTLASPDSTSLNYTATPGDFTLTVFDDLSAPIADKTVICPTMTPTATPSETNTPSNTPTPSVTFTPTDTPTSTHTTTNTFTPTDTLTPSLTLTPSNTSAPTLTSTNTTAPTLTLTRKPSGSSSEDGEEGTPTPRWSFPWQQMIATLSPSPSPTHIPAAATSVSTPAARAAQTIVSHESDLPTLAAAAAPQSAQEGFDGKLLIPMIGLGALCTGTFLSVVVFQHIRK